MKVTVKLESEQEFWGRAQALALKLDRKEAVENENSISIETLDDLLQLLTPERLRLLSVARQSRKSISALAEELGRDRKAVTRDVQALRRLGILRVRKETNPGHGIVQVVEPTATKLDLRIAL